MAFSMDEIHVYDGQHLVCGEKKVPKALGVGPMKTPGSMYCEGPHQNGAVDEFSVAEGVTMLGQASGNIKGPQPVYALLVKTFARIKKFLKVDELLVVKTIKSKIIYTEILMARTKNFIIDHPSEEGKKLVHACLEGPENAVYIRGRVVNKNSIVFPYYWKDLVDWTTVTVSLTPIGSHQNVIVKRIDENQVHLQSNGGLPINCYYHIYATRKDVPRLITEVDA